MQSKRSWRVMTRLGGWPRLIAAVVDLTLGKRGLLLIYVVSVFFSAALLFLSEPLVGRLLLPLFGGSPAVWNTCMVFFQAVFLAAYAYVHLSVKWLGLKRQAWLHMVVAITPLAALPLVLPHWAAGGSDTSDLPVLRLLGILTVTIGAPFFVLATTGPLLQRWFAATSHPGAGRPYFLYAASNLGSFVALLAYPLLVEPTLSLRLQTKIWGAGYGLFVVLVVVCALALRRFLRPPSLVNSHQAAVAPRPIYWKHRFT